MPFATLDDSLVHKDGFYVYTHALVRGRKKRIFVLTWTKDNELPAHEIERRLCHFLERTLGSYSLIACAHYNQYRSIFRKMFMSINDPNKMHFSEKVRDDFKDADQLARAVAYMRLEELIDKEHHL